MPDTQTNEEPDDGGPMFLGNPVIVFDLVRQFFMAVSEVVEDTSEGQIDHDQATAQIAEAADDMANIFMGRDPGFIGVEGWTGSALAQSVRSASPDEADALASASDASVLGLFFSGSAASLGNIIAEHAAGKLDDQAYQSAAGGLVMAVTNALTGENGNAGQ